MISKKGVWAWIMDKRCGPGLETKGVTQDLGTRGVCPD